MSPPRVQVVLPVYNEGQAIYDLLAAYAQVLPRLGLAHAILVIDDHSSDDSPQWLAKARQDFPGLNLTLHRHQANRGLHGVLNTALEALDDLGDGDILVTMDGDNTHNPHLIPEMLAKIEQGADLVIASRYCEQSRVAGLSRSRMVLSQGAGWLYRLAWGLPGVRDYTCLFRMYRGSLINRFRREHRPPYLRQQGFTCTSELLRKLALQEPVCVEVPMILRYGNKVGVSNMRVWRTVLKTLGMLAGRSPR